MGTTPVKHLKLQKLTDDFQMFEDAFEITFWRKLIFRDIFPHVTGFYLVLHMYFQKYCLEMQFFFWVEYIPGASKSLQNSAHDNTSTA